MPVPLFCCRIVTSANIQPVVTATATSMATELQWADDSKKYIFLWRRRKWSYEAHPIMMSELSSPAINFNGKNTFNGKSIDLVHTEINTKPQQQHKKWKKENREKKYENWKIKKKIHSQTHTRTKAKWNKNVWYVCNVHITHIYIQRKLHGLTVWRESEIRASHNIMKMIITATISSLLIPLVWKHSHSKSRNMRGKKKQQQQQ